MANTKKPSGGGIFSSVCGISTAIAISNCSSSSNRIAVLEQEELVQLFVDFPSHTKMVGNIDKFDFSKISLISIQSHSFGNSA